MVIMEFMNAVSFFFYFKQRTADVCSARLVGEEQSRAEHSTAQHSTAQHSTAEQSRAEQSRAQHSTAQPLYSTDLTDETICPESGACRVGK